jgi:hypothetical protein
MESNNKDAIEAVVKALELMVSVCESKEEGVLRRKLPVSVAVQKKLHMKIKNIPDFTFQLWLESSPRAPASPLKT